MNHVIVISKHVVFKSYLRLSRSIRNKPCKPYSRIQIVPPSLSHNLPMTRRLNRNNRTYLQDLTHVPSPRRNMSTKQHLNIPTMCSSHVMRSLRKVLNNSTRRLLPWHLRAIISRDISSNLLITSVPMSTHKKRVHLFQRGPSNRNIVTILFSSSFQNIRCRTPSLNNKHPLTFYHFPGDPRVLLHVVPPLQVGGTVQPMNPYAIP